MQGSHQGAHDGNDQVEGPLRPGIVHRLDLGTSGVLAAARTEAAYLHLKGQFRAHGVERFYLALCRGEPAWERTTVENFLAQRRLGRKGLPLPDDAVVLTSFGDASANHSTAQGAFNTAGWAAFQGTPMPLIFLCEDNGIGISTRTPTGRRGSRPAAQTTRAREPRSATSSAMNPSPCCFPM